MTARAPSWRAGRPKGTRLFPPAAFDAILRRVARGERPKDICAEPGQPSLHALFRHRKTNAGFDARWTEAVGRRVLPSAIEIVLHRVERGENLVDVCAQPGMPSAATIAAHRRKNPDQEPRWIEALGKRPGAKVERTPARVSAYLQELEQGRPTRVLGGLIDWKVIRRLRREDAAFEARFARAQSAGRSAALRAASSRRLSPTEIFSLVEEAVRHVPPHARDDVRGDLMVSLLEGRVAPESARAAVRQLVTTWNRNFDRRDVSMDAEIGEGGLTFSALIADPGSYVPSGVQLVGWRFGL